MKHNHPLSFAYRHFYTYTFCHTQPTRLQIIIFSATIYILVQCFSEGSALVKVIIIIIIVVIHVHVQVEQHKHIYTVAFICSKIGCTYQYMSHIINPIRSGLFQTVNDPGGGGFKSPPYDLENYCVNLHHIIHVNFTRCFWHNPIRIFQKFAILTILQRFQNKK